MSILHTGGIGDFFNLQSHQTATLDRDTQVYTISGFPSFPSSISVETRPLYLQKILIDVAITSSTGNNPILVNVLDTATTGDLSGSLGDLKFGLVINGSNNALTNRNIDFPGMGFLFKNGLGLFSEHSGIINGFVRTTFFYRLK
jgi:hypothetical protein